MYSALITLALIGLFIITIGLFVMWPRKQRGATPAEDWEILAHQQIRRVENGLQD